MKIQYLAILCILANFKNIINVIEINVAITVPTPVFTPIRSRINDNASSVVVGIKNSDIDNLIGSENFSIPNIELIEKSASRNDETIRACLFRLGKRLRIPLPNITPWNKPIPKITVNVIKKFCSANSNTFKFYTLCCKIRM